MIDLDTSEYGQKAMELFKEGYNCSQSVVLAFADKYDLDTSTILKLSSSFGGGMGRLREVCGGVSGMLMVLGLLYGYDGPKDLEGKTEHYKRVQELAGSFSEITGSIVCRELLGLTEKKQEPTPEARTPEYYKRRPCVQMVGTAAAIMEDFINRNDKNTAIS